MREFFTIATTILYVAILRVQVRTADQYNWKFWLFMIGEFTVWAIIVIANLMLDAPYGIQTERGYKNQVFLHEEDGFIGDCERWEFAGWYYWDETGTCYYGPFNSQDEAEMGLADYRKYLRQQVKGRVDKC